jgi:hypothetical protein
MWLLPQGKSYGFKHVIPKDSLLLMRGDFTHAGGLQRENGHRCHMVFYPKMSAGWRDHSAYWLPDSFQNPNMKDATNTSFVCQKHLYPFAFPVASKACEGLDDDEVLISYPPDITDMLHSEIASIRKVAQDMIRATKDGIFF